MIARGMEQRVQLAGVASRRRLLKLTICASASVIASVIAAPAIAQDTLMAAPPGADLPPPPPGAEPTQNTLMAAPPGADLPPPPGADGQPQDTIMAAPPGANLPAPPPPPAATSEMRRLPAPGVRPADDDRANVLTNEEIVVTATKREANLQNLPLAVSAIGGEELQQRGIREIEQYYREVPGVALIDLGPGSKKYVIRGINTELLPNGEPQVQQYLDDVPLSSDTPQPDIRLYDLERVEILRGPQGTLFGSGSMGGTVRNISRKPNLDEFDGYVEATGSQTRHAGELNRLVQGAVSVPLVEGVLGLRVNAYDEHNAGFIDNVARGLKDNNDLDVWGGRVTALLKPTDGFSLQLMYLHQDMKADDLNTVEFNAPAVTPLPPRPPAFPGRAGKPATVGKLQSRIPTTQEFLDVNDIVNLTVEADLGFANLLSSSNYYQRDRLDNLPLPAIGAGPPIWLQTPFTGKSLVEEARLTSKDDGPLQWLTGVYYSETKTVSVQKTLGIPDNVPAEFRPPENKIVAERSTASLFGEASYRVTPKLTGTLGLRYSKYRNLRASDPAVDPTEESVTYKVHAAYQANDNLLLYALTSSGFRGGGINNPDRAFLIRNGVSPADVDATPRQFDGEELRNYEIGLKSTFLDGRATLNLAAYRADYENMWTQFYYTGTPFAYTASAGSAKIDGVEFEGRVRPVDALELRASGAWVNARVTEGAPPGQAGPKSARPGDDLPYVPEWSGSVGADYTLALSSRSDLILSADASYTGSSNTSISSVDPNLRRLPDYVLANLRATLNLDNYSVALFVRNLTDKRAVLTINNLADRLGTGDSDLISVNQPRTIGVTGKVNF